MPLLVDTGVLYALADIDDDWHARSRALLSDTGELLLAPAPVLPEVTYLLRLRLGARAERKFVDSIASGGLAVEELRTADHARVAALLDKYLDLGFVDAAVVAVAERLKVVRLATTDRRHFSTVRPEHAKAFELVP
jgi:uncharacterized protein